MKSLAWGILRNQKSPEFLYSFQIFSFLGNTHRCFSVDLGQKAYVSRMCAPFVSFTCYFKDGKFSQNCWGWVWCWKSAGIKGRGIAHRAGRLLLFTQYQHFKKVLPALRVLSSSSGQQLPTTTASYLHSPKTVGVQWLRSSQRKHSIFEIKLFLFFGTTTQ